MPVAAPGVQSIMLLFVPGVAACILYSSVFAQALAYLGAIFIAGSVMAFSTGRPDAAMWMIQSIGTLLVVLMGLRRKMDAPLVFLQCVVFLCVTTMAGFLIASGTDVAETYRSLLASLADEFDASFKAYASGAGAGSVTPEMTLLFQQVKETIIRFFPGIVMSSMVFTAFFNVLLCARCVSRQALGHSPFSRFAYWRMPEWLVWPWIVAGGACFTGHSLYSMIGENALLAVSVIFLVAGLSVAQYLMERFSVPTWIRWTTWILIGLQWYGLLVLTGLGLADVYVDFRKRFALPEENGT